MMLRLRPRAISPTRTTILPVPISTAPMIRLLLEVTFAFPLLRRWKGEIFGRQFRQLVGRVAHLHRNLAIEGQIYGEQRGFRHHPHGIDYIIKLRDLAPEVALPAENDFGNILRLHDDFVARFEPVE